MTKLLLIVWCLTLGVSQARASSDHEQARAAVQSGQILPLQTVLRKVEEQHPGIFLEAELEKDDGVWVYEIKLLQASGQRLKLKVDAATGKMLKHAKRYP